MADEDLSGRTKRVGKRFWAQIEELGDNPEARENLAQNVKNGLEAGADKLLDAAEGAVGGVEKVTEALTKDDLTEEEIKKIWDEQGPDGVAKVIEKAGYLSLFGGMGGLATFLTTKGIGAVVKKINTSPEDTQEAFNWGQALMSGDFSGMASQVSEQLSSGLGMLDRAGSFISAIPGDIGNFLKDIFGSIMSVIGGIMPGVQDMIGGFVGSGEQEEAPGRSEEGPSSQRTPPKPEQQVAGTDQTAGPKGLDGVDPLNPRYNQHAQGQSEAAPEPEPRVAGAPATTPANEPGSGIS